MSNPESEFADIVVEKMDPTLRAARKERWVQETVRDLYVGIMISGEIVDCNAVMSYTREMANVLFKEDNE